MIELGDWQFYFIGTANGILIGYFILTKDIVRKHFKMQDKQEYVVNDKGELNKR